MESENNENILVNITTNKNIKKNEVNSFKNITSNENIDKKTSITITYPDSTKDSEGNTTYTGYYKSLTLEKKMNLPCETRYLDYNNDNTCGSLATAIMFYYYYDYINRSYIKSDKYIGTGYVRQKAFYDSFKPLLGDNGDGTSYTQVKNGINKYLKSIEKNPTCTYITTANLLYNVTSKIIDCIENRKPCIVGLSNEPKYGNHWVVGVGYARYQAVDDWDLINIDFIKINNGWYTTKSHSIVYVNSMYVDGLIYLK